MTAPHFADTARRVEQSGGISGGDPFYRFAISGVSAARLQSASILDLGCGQGEFGRFLQGQFKVRPYGVDLIRYPGFHVDSYHGFQSVDLDALASANLSAEWDLIFAIGILEYLPNPRLFLQAAARLLRPRGQLFITSPNPMSLRSLLSAVRKGEFSAFQEANNPASITPVTAVDAVRMFREANLASVKIDYSGRGSIPGAGMAWQQLLPSLRGRWFSDDFRIVGTASAMHL